MKSKLALLVPVLLVLILAPAGAAVRYVNLANPSPAPPYISWASAATNIQDAIDAALAGDEIVVTNGVYATGERVIDGGLLASRVAVTKPVTIRSVNGPAATHIRGRQVPLLVNGDGAVRCVFLGNGASLLGFTLTNGATLSCCHLDNGVDQSGGGVACESSSAVVSNCVITGNSAYSHGGGSFGGTLRNCVLTANSCMTFGGGAAGGTLINCVISGNSAELDGGGTWAWGFQTLLNCTVVGNSAGRWAGGVSGWAVTKAIYPVHLKNCIVSANTAGWGENNYREFPALFSDFQYSCTTPLPPGPGNVDVNPLFVSGTCYPRLRPGSPCIDAGTNLSSLFNIDIAGNPRSMDGNGDGIAAFDMGAYEFDPGAPGPLVITHEAFGADGKLHIGFGPMLSASYYILYRGASLTHIDTSVALKLGDCGPPSLVDSMPVTEHGTAFYRVREEPITQPLDSDGDGIDDFYELSHPRLLDPLNAADAAQDYDGDGKSNRQEYRDGSNPARSPGQALAANDHGWFALKTNGSLWFFDSGQGQLQRIGGNSNYVAVFPSGFPVAAGDDWVFGNSTINGGPFGGPHTLAIKSDGSLWARGENLFGQLGDGTFESRENLSRVGIDSNWRIVASGTGFSTGIKTDGTLWAWGDNQLGQLGNGTNDPGSNLPIQIGNDHKWVAVDNSKFDYFWSHSVALKSDGSIWAWGVVIVSALGADVIVTNVPTRIGTDTDWHTFSVGTTHVVALKSDGSLWTSDHSILEVGWSILGTLDRLGTDSNWVAVAAGFDSLGEFSAALKRDGTLWSWRLGESPQQVGTDTDWGLPP